MIKVSETNNFSSDSKAINKTVTRTAMNKQRIKLLQYNIIRGDK